MIISISKIVVATLSSIRLLPHIAVFVLSPKQELLRKDLERYGVSIDGIKPQSAVERVILFIKMMTYIREYRNIFYLRHKTIGHILGLLCPPMNGFKINAKKCGPGLFVRHGFGTLISAEEIGAHCSIGQAVSIGYVNNSVDRPKIGNNVTIGDGARVLGAVTIGDNAFISPNSLVISNVLPGATVMGVPSKSIRQPETRP